MKIEPNTLNMKKKKREFHLYVNVQHSLKKQNVTAVKPIFLQAIWEPYVGFANTTVFKMLQHLYDGYAELLADDLELNYKHLHEQWDQNTPFSTLFKQIRDAMDLADHAGVTYTDKQIVSVAYTLVKRTGVLETECKRWIERTEQQKTWT